MSDIEKAVSEGQGYSQPISVFNSRNIKAACTRVIDGEIPIRVEAVLQEAWNRRIEIHSGQLNCLEYGC